MGIETRFEQAVSQWKAHCASIRYSSLGIDRIECDAYKEIVAMGRLVLPLIRNTYAGPEEDAFFPIFGWSCAVREIVGSDFQIPEEIRGRVDAIRDYTVRWLDENMHQYI